MAENLRLLVSEIVAAQKITGEAENWWKAPLLVTASADERFDVLPKIVHPKHLLPRDLLVEARTVAVFFLPFKRELVSSNLHGLHGNLSSRKWAQSYVDTNALIAEINRKIKTHLEGLGFKSAITPATHNFNEKELVSAWSHKHLAVLSGLGCLGHHTQLITPRGCSGRLGSLVTEAELGDSPLVAGGSELCLHKKGQRCLACVKKCRFGALTSDGLDRFRCYDQLLVNDRANPDLPLTDVCGKCATMVPCSFRVPQAAGVTTNSQGR